MPTFSNIGLAEPSTITNRVGAVTLARGTTNEQQEILVLGDPDTSNALAAVLNAGPASTAWGLVVRQLDSTVSIAAGSTLAVRPLQSSAADLQVTATPAAGSTFAVRPLQSSAADLQVTVTPAVGSTFAVRALQSSAADLNVTVSGYSTIATVSTLQGRVLSDQNSTTWFTQAAIRDSSGVGLGGSTTAPSTGAQGLVVRSVLNNLQSTGLSTLGNNSTSSTLVSSAASLRTKVYAYSIVSTVQAVQTLTFNSSAGTNVLWALQLQSISSGIAGANLAVTPPAWLFATEAGSPLVFKVTGTTGTYHVSVSYFQEA